MLPRVPFSSCVERWAADEELGDYYSAALGKRTTATRRSRIASFPPFLMVQLKRCAPSARCSGGPLLAGQLAISACYCLCNKFRAAPSNLTIPFRVEYASKACHPYNRKVSSCCPLPALYL